MTVNYRRIGINQMSKETLAVYWSTCYEALARPVTCRLLDYLRKCMRIKIPSCDPCDMNTPSSLALVRAETIPKL
jgi:hypothetical protein